MAPTYGSNSSACIVGSLSVADPTRTASEVAGLNHSENSLSLSRKSGRQPISTARDVLWVGPSIHAGLDWSIHEISRPPLGRRDQIDNLCLCFCPTTSVSIVVM
jgi:hypothetical protein